MRPAVRTVKRHIKGKVSYYLNVLIICILTKFSPLPVKLILLEEDKLYLILQFLLYL